MFYSLFFKGLNYGIDFKGGTFNRIKNRQIINPSIIREALNSMNLGDVNVKNLVKKEIF